MYVFFDDLSKNMSNLQYTIFRCPLSQYTLQSHRRHDEMLCFICLPINRLIFKSFRVFTRKCLPSEQVVYVAHKLRKMTRFEKIFSNAFSSRSLYSGIYSIRPTIQLRRIQPAKESGEIYLISHSYFLVSY